MSLCISTYVKMSLKTSASISGMETAPFSAIDPSNILWNTRLALANINLWDLIVFGVDSTRNITSHIIWWFNIWYKRSDNVFPSCQSYAIVVIGISTNIKMKIFKTIDDNELSYQKRQYQRRVPMIEDERRVFMTEDERIISKSGDERRVAMTEE